MFVGTFTKKRPSKKAVDAYWKLRRELVRVNACEREMQALADDEFPAKTAQFRDRIARGESLDELLPESFALTREAALLVELARDPEAGRATLTSLSDAWEDLFRTGEHQTADRIAAVLAALTMESRS